MAADVTTLATSFKNSGYVSVEFISYPSAAVKGTVANFGARSAVALEDTAADESCTFGFGGEWQFAAGSISGTATVGAKVFDDGTGALTAGGSTGTQVGVVTQVTADVVIIMLF